MRQVTLCFLVKPEQVCLAMKKRGFGAGKYNGVGGKVEEGETIKEAAIRELYEEIGVKAEPESLDSMGSIKFYFENKPDWNQEMNIFFIKNWEDEPKESEEMAPQWYGHSEIPFNSMWVDDPHWLPKVLAGKRIEGEFHFTEDGSKINKFELRELV